MKGANVNIKLIIEDRESGTRNWFLVPYLSNVWDISKLLIGNRESETGNRELVPCPLFWCIIPMFQKCNSGIRSQFPVPF